MKRLLIVCAFGLSFATAQAAPAPTEFAQAFAAHQKAGTLLDYTTPEEFKTEGWGQLYRNELVRTYQGQSVNGLRLEVKTSEGYEAKVGTQVALDFTLYNDSDEELTVTTNGSCQTVHQARYTLINPQGEVWPNIARPSVGGPHCFCSQHEAKLPAHASVHLDTRADSDSVVGFAPSQPGKYVVIGTYSLGVINNAEVRVLSAPLELNVTK